MMNNFKKTVFIWLFVILYVSVALVSTFHAISFFGLANTEWISILLAITFEIGQAAVLFSILSRASGKNKIVPWILMIVLTLVQILGNVYSSYQYLITNSSNLLRFFKEPIFVWTDLPDQQCNVILTYIVGAILPIVSLLMTSMVTNYIESNDSMVDNPNTTEMNKDTETENTKQENIEQEKEQEKENPVRKSGFINL